MDPDVSNFIHVLPGVVYRFMVSHDGNWTFLYLSEGIRELYECTPETAYSDHQALTNCILDEDKFSYRQSIEQATKHLTPWTHIYRIVTSSGKIKWIRGQANPEQQGDGSVLWSGILIDVTEDKAIQAKLFRLQKLYSAVIESGRLISKENNLNEMFQGVCKIVVDLGGMKMAWVGIPNETDLRLVPVTRYGEGIDYLDKVLISARADIPEGQGPSGTSYRECRTVLNQDFNTNKITQPWHEYGKTYGWGSSATFSIKHGDRSYASLTVYSSERNAFDKEVVELLEGVATDLSYAIEKVASNANKLAMNLALANSEEQFRLMFENTLLGVVFQNGSGEIYLANRIAQDILGLSLDQMQGRTSLDPRWRSIHEDGTDYPGNTHPAMQALISGKPVNNAVMGVFNPKLNQINWINISAIPLMRSGENKPRVVFSTFQDITERKQFESLVSESNLRLNRILDNLFAYVALLDINGVVEEVNKAPLDRAGYRREDVIGQYFYDAPWWNYDNEIREQLIAAINAAKQGKSSRYDVVVKMGDDLVPIDFLITPVRDDSGTIVGLLPTAVDITERKLLEVELQRQANLDYLTGLPSRRSFMEKSEVELSRAKRYGKSLSIMMLDIDFFKQINDTHGHQAGDLVLKSLAITFQEVLRNVDLIGRLGGEEFAAVLPETGIDRAVEVAERLREVISAGQVTIQEGVKIHFTVSIGIAALVDPHSNIDILLNEADKALYRAKQTGRNKVSR